MRISTIWASAQTSTSLECLNLNLIGSKRMSKFPSCYYNYNTNYKKLLFFNFIFSLYLVSISSASNSNSKDSDSDSKESDSNPNSKTNPNPSPTVTWTEEINLDKDFKFKWTNLEDPDYITIEISAPTIGYISIGFSPSGKMAKSDIVLGWVDPKGNGHLKDLHANGNETPVEDKKQNYDLLFFEENNSRTTLRFRRKLNTKDKEQDFNLKPGNKVFLIWSWSPRDPLMENDGSFKPFYHGNSRGSKLLKLSSPKNQTKTEELTPRKKRKKPEFLETGEVFRIRNYIFHLETLVLLVVRVFFKKFHHDVRSNGFCLYKNCKIIPKNDYLKNFVYIIYKKGFKKTCLQTIKLFYMAANEIYP